MTTYRAPLRDMRFVLHELARIDALAQLPGFEAAAEVVDDVLAEAASFASEALDALNVVGDTHGCTWKDGVVTTPPGFKEAYRQFAQAGWIGLPVSEEYGGQGLPQLLLGPTLEMWNGANVGFANGPLLNQGAIEALELCGSDAQKQTYIPKLVSGEWTGTMCLTEPQAGSDLAAVRTHAVPDGDRYRLRGQKIFITFGEHDMAENIVHLVLARLPDAPEGTKGISLFIVPKFVVNADGTLGERNDVACAGIEHKLGINANPTCTLNYGERGGALGELVGEPNRGLEYMFVMMNAARFSVGVQGLAIADRAYQSALAYAKERVQGRDVTTRSPQAVTIINHPDVRRMLMTMKANVEAMRALAYVTAASLDLQHKAADEAERKRHRAFVEFMIPIVKGWCTETAVEVCSTAVQVFGGMGFIEETGIAQQYRDVRITTIYEGTTGIQALDLVGRKLIRDMGATATRLIAELGTFAATLDASGELASIRTQLEAGVAALTEASTWIGMTAMSDLARAFAGSVPYLRLWGIVAGGWQMARAAQIAAARVAAGDPEAEFYRAKLATARFYADSILCGASSLTHQIVHGSAGVAALSEDAFELDRRSAATAGAR
jgi:3-(methylthio)propanoyl-CoA dehydrogenase